MKVVHSLDEIPSGTPSVVTIGNFDGVHRGHGSILDTVARRAAASDLQSVAVTFDPHPLWQIAPERAPVPITTLEEKTRLIAECSIDFLLVQKFDDRFRRLSPSDFVQSFLIDGLHARTVCVGQNFRFGNRHAGNIETLRGWSAVFDVVEVAPVLDRDVPISSSRIRELVTAGEVGRARRMLDRCHQIEGRIVGGARRGRELTVPTLNLASVTALTPADGVYLTRVSIDGGVFQDSLTNIGVRPTFESAGRNGARSIETYVLDTTISPDARQVCLRFVKRLRQERRFPTPEDLRRQIGRDTAFAQRFFRRMDRLRTVGCTTGDDG